MLSTDLSWVGSSSVLPVRSNLWVLMTGQRDSTSITCRTLDCLYVPPRVLSVLAQCSSGQFRNAVDYNEVSVCAGHNISKLEVDDTLLLNQTAVAEYTTNTTESQMTEHEEDHRNNADSEDSDRQAPITQTSWQLQGSSSREEPACWISA